MATQRKKISTLTLALAGMMAAMVFVATYFLKLPVPMTSGYVHLGDAFILIGAGLLGAISIPAAALGSMLADILLGYTVYAVPTLVCKGLVAYVAVLGARNKSIFAQIGMMVLAEVCMVAVYFLCEATFLGYGFAGAAANIVGNLTQGASGVIIAAVLLPVLKRAKLPLGK